MILIAIGANLPLAEGGNARDACEAAVAAIRAIEGLQFVACSPWYRTAPIPRADQPDYCNGMVRLEGEMTPVELLAKLQALELELGRVRGERNAARVIDLDIIDLNGTIRALPDPVLPHPRAHLRAFVLRPLLDVAPAWRHPVLRKNVTTLLAELPPQEIAPWGEDD